jgi:AhpD family alkylhydroperoxidase
MARVPYASTEEGGLLSSVYRSTGRLFGRTSNFHRILGHVPDAYAWYLPFQSTVMRGEGRSYLAKPQIALASLATSEANRCRYCATHNTATALKSGISLEKTEWLREQPEGDPSTGPFNAEEQLIIRWARAVTMNQARRAVTLFKELESAFTHEQIVELTVIIAARTFTNLIQEALWTDLEEPEPQADPSAPAKVKEAKGPMPTSEFRKHLRDHSAMLAEYFDGEDPNH